MDTEITKARPQPPWPPEPCIGCGDPTRNAFALLFCYGAMTPTRSVCDGCQNVAMEKVNQLVPAVVRMQALRLTPAEIKKVLNMALERFFEDVAFAS